MSVYHAVNVLNKDTVNAINFIESKGYILSPEMVEMRKFIKLVSDWFSEINVKSYDQVKCTDQMCENVLSYSEKILAYDDEQKLAGYSGLAEPTRKGLKFTFLDGDIFFHG